MHGGHDGAPNISHVQCLAAFLLAVEEINADPNLLPNTKIRFAFRSAEGYSNTIYAVDELLRSVFGNNLYLEIIVICNLLDNVLLPCRTFTKYRR
jgi:hypothetical protein